MNKLKLLDLMVKRDKYTPTIWHAGVVTSISNSVYYKDAFIEADRGFNGLQKDLIEELKNFYNFLNQGYKIYSCTNFKAKRDSYTPLNCMLDNEFFLARDKNEAKALLISYNVYCGSKPTRQLSVLKEYSLEEFHNNIKKIMLNRWENQPR